MTGQADQATRISDHEAVRLLRAKVGAISLEFAAAGVVAAPEVFGSYVTEIDGTPVLAVIESDEVYLLMDHRPAAQPGRQAYVEFWCPLAAPEMPIAGLLVVGRDDESKAASPNIPSLKDVVARLYRTDPRR
jgi:hypothetical protein